MNPIVGERPPGDRLARAVLTLERHALAVLAAVAVVYLAGTFGRASQKLLWHDELFTLHMSRLPVTDLWPAIATPSDATPPLFHLFTRASMALAGSGLITTRLPAIVGYLVAMLCLYAFVARRCGRVYGVIAAVMPLATQTYVFAYEARAYGLVLGFSGLGLLSWQAAAEGRRSRRFSLTLLLVSTATAIACHYYAVLLLVPLCAAELARWWARRKPDWALWAVLTASAFPLVVLSPLVRSARVIAAGWFSAIAPRMVFETYEEALIPLVVPALVSIGLVGIATGVRSHERFSEPRPAPVGAPLYEWIAAIVLLTTPMWAGAVAGVVIGSFVPRYALQWTLGFSVVVAFAMATLSARPRFVGAIVMVTLVGWTGLRGVSSARLLAAERPTIESNHHALFALSGPTLPIAVTHAHLYLPLAEYAPRELGARLVLPTLPPRLAAHIGESGDRAMIGLAKWAPLNVQDFDAFVAGRPTFLLYGPPLWMGEELRKAGARLTLKGEDHYTPPFAMSRPECVFVYEVTFD